MPTVEIDKDKYTAFAARAEDKGFDSAEEYVQHVLQQVYDKLQRQEKTFSDEDEEKVRDRLRNLGYMD